MTRRTWRAAVLAAAGAGLLVSAGVAGGQRTSETSERRGGTYQLTIATDFDYIDPALAYFFHSGTMQAATQLRLLFFPPVEGPESKRLRPMAAEDLPQVSADGLTYTFALRRGFRFSNGEPVTARSFVRAFQRVLSPKLRSPGSSFLDDVRRYWAPSRYVLKVKLEQVAPDFLARMTMTFFSAVPESVPATTAVAGAPLVSAGPYYLAEWTQRRSALAVRNPYWDTTREPWRSLGIPANVDRIVWTIVPTLAIARLLCEQNEADQCGMAPPQAAELAEKYGINQGRFFVRKGMTVGYLALNTERPLFRDNPRLRRAVAFALDRRFLVAQSGYLGASRTDQILPPGMPGFRSWDVYSLAGPNLARARELANGSLRGGKAVLYAGTVGADPAIAQAVQFQLAQIGLEVEIRQFDPVVVEAKAATRGEPFDILLAGWAADYPDPSNFINVLLDGRRLQAVNNVNKSYWNDPVFNRRMDEAYRASGEERLRLYGLLDRDIVRDAAPIVPFRNGNARIFVGPDVGCFSYSSLHGTNLVAVCKTR